jgi:integrase
MPSTVTTAYALPGLKKWTGSQRDAPKHPPAPTFGAFVEDWMARQKVLAHGGLLRINSLQRYQSALQAHLLPFFAARPLDSITRRHCDDFRMAAVASGRLNPGTVNSIMQMLRLVLKAACREGLIDRDPLSGMRPLRVSPRLIDPYDSSEIRRLINAAQPADQLVIGLASLAGLRQGEAFAIRPGDVDLRGRRLQVTRSLQRHHPEFSTTQRLGSPKTTLGYRGVPLQAELTRLIETHLAEHWTPNRHDLLCPCPRGQPRAPIVFHRETFIPAIRKAGLRPMRYHDLRRSFVSQCVAAGVPVAQTAAWLGHTIAMTEHYYQVGEAQLIAALALLDQRSGQ